MSPLPSASTVPLPAGQPRFQPPSNATWVVMLSVLCWLACTAWWRPLAVPDEGRYAGVAWEMLRSGDWLTPTLNGLPFFHKPPLFYWLTAVSIKVFGMNVWAARLASVLGAWLGAMAVYGLLRRWRGERVALLTLLVLLTQPFYFGGAQYANLDMLVAGCISATIALAAQAVLAREAGRPYRAALWGAYALAALGLLAKGLIGLVLPGAVIVVWMLSTGRWRQLLQLFSFSGLLVLLAVAGPWFVAMQERYPAFFHYFFIYQHFQRFTETGFNNMHPWWYYGPMLVVLTLPWVPLGLYAWWRSRGVVGETVDGTVGPGTERDLRRLMACWLGVILVFFSLPASKLPGYVLPVLPPLAALVAEALLRRWPQASDATRGMLGAALRRWVLGAAALCLLAMGLVVHFDRQSARPVVATLRTLQAQGVPLVFVDRFVYDLPFLMALREPVPVISGWDDPAIRKRDDDRKELLDAGDFDPEKAAALLVPSAQWPRWLCRSPRLAVMAPLDAASRYPQLAATAPVAQLRLYSLWVLDRAQLEAQGLHCDARDLPSTSPGR